MAVGPGVAGVPKPSPSWDKVPLSAGCPCTQRWGPWTPMGDPWTEKHQSPQRVAAGPAFGGRPVVAAWEMAMSDGAGTPGAEV